MKVYIHVDRPAVSRNRGKRPVDRDPTVEVITSLDPYISTWHHGVAIHGPCTLVYDPEHPLPHGPSVWLETTSPVTATERTLT